MGSGEATDSALLYKTNLSMTSESLIKNWYLSASSVENGDYPYELYTYYKYTTYDADKKLILQTFSSSPWEDGNLVPNNGAINSGRITYMAETVRVILGGGSYIAHGNNSVQTSGSISIS